MLAGVCCQQPAHESLKHGRQNCKTVICQALKARNLIYNQAVQSAGLCEALTSMLSGRFSCSKAREAASCFSGAICENGRKPAETISSSQPPQRGAQNTHRKIQMTTASTLTGQRGVRPPGPTPCWLGCWLKLRPVCALFLPCAYCRDLGIPREKNIWVYTK